LPAIIKDIFYPKGDGASSLRTVFFALILFYIKYHNAIIFCEKTNDEKLSGCP